MHVQDPELPGSGTGHDADAHIRTRNGAAMTGSDSLCQFLQLPYEYMLLDIPITNIPWAMVILH